MSYLIDGHNLVPHIPGLALKDIEDERRLIETLQDYCARHNRRVEVFFDNAPAGRAGAQRLGLVTAHFVRAGSSADDAIRRRLARLGKEARNWTVVSSDREVQRAARQAGARVIASREFARQIGAGGARADHEAGDDAELSEAEIREWLHLFGEDE